MKVLFDENLGYKRHALSLPGHDVFSNRHMGWEGLPDHVVVEKAVTAIEEGFSFVIEPSGERAEWFDKSPRFSSGTRFCRR